MGTIQGERNATFERREYWDGFYAEDGDDLDFYEWYSADWLHEVVAEELVRLSGSAVLDVGCGTSPLLFDLASSSPNALKLHGIDFAGDAIRFMREAAKREGVDISFDVADVSDGFPGIHDDTYDVVVDKGCLDCFVTGKGEALIEAYLAEVQRVLKPGGTLLLLAVSFADVPKLVDSHVLVADRHAEGGRFASAAALEKQKAIALEAQPRQGGPARHDLHVHKVLAYQQKHLHFCQAGAPQELHVECGVCGSSHGDQYPALEEHCSCGNRLRRFALS